MTNWDKGGNLEKRGFCMIQSYINKRRIRRARYEITIERLQLLLTENGWCKPDLAKYLGISTGVLNQILSHDCQTINSQLARKIRCLRTTPYSYYDQQIDIDLYFPFWPNHRDNDHQ